MSDIILLDEATIDKIAAGEVVERPASVVKELMENAIDAGATAISVEIKNGGIELIRVTDNGSGIPADQVRTAVMRHATSKIRTADDISFVHTLGFRGEALSSIAAVSNMEICTRTRSSVTGVIYRIHAGRELSLTQAGLPQGTTIIVRDLFANVPARSKFLATPHSEGSKVTDVVEKMVLSHPDVSIKFINNGSQRIATSGNGSSRDSVYAVFGREVASNLIPVEGAFDMYSIEGFIGKPEVARGNRNYEIYFVNGRYVKDRIIAAAIEDAYKGYQMKGTFPFTVLNITVEPELLDVNVHPAKSEIRFSDGETAFNAISSILSRVIRNRENIPEFTVEARARVNDEMQELTTDPGYIENQQNIEESTIIPQDKILDMLNEFKDIKSDHASESSKAIRSYTSAAFSSEKPVSPVGKSDKAPAIELAEPFEEKQHKQQVDYMAIISEAEEAAAKQMMREPTQYEFFISEKARASHRVIGEVFDTYWLVEYENKLFIIDQHAAHEKVLYERFMKKLREDNLGSQMISPGILLTLSSDEAIAFNRYNEQFKQLGFEVEYYGGSDYIITAVPTDLYSLSNKDLFLSFLDELTENPTVFSSEMLLDRVATSACKAAVKGNNRLSFAEADKLIDELLTLENPYNCPHGRPTIISMTKTELEKKFKRII